MELGTYPGLSEVSKHHLREYMLDMLQELATVAARRGDADSAKALQVCWTQIRAKEDH